VSKQVASAASNVEDAIWCGTGRGDERRGSLRDIPMQPLEETILVACGPFLECSNVASSRHAPNLSSA
jgi:hypothetical protein